jgi:hypothetical protein
LITILDAIHQHLTHDHPGQFNILIATRHGIRAIFFDSAKQRVGNQTSALSPSWFRGHGLSAVTTDL